MTTTSSARRTQRDLVDAAIRCWAVDNTASLGAVAELAGTGRTTLHRYFANRAELVAAVDLECRTRFDDAVARARPTEGNGLAALQRACVELVALGPVLGLIFADNALVDPDTWHPDDPEGRPEDEDPLGRLVGRAYEDGSVDVSLPPEWVGTTVWTTLFAAWLYLQGGTATAHEAALLCADTVARSVGAPGGSRLRRQPKSSTRRPRTPPASIRRWASAASAAGTRSATRRVTSPASACSRSRSSAAVFCA